MVSWLYVCNRVVVLLDDCKTGIIKSTKMGARVVRACSNKNHLSLIEKHSAHTYACFIHTRQCMKTLCMKIGASLPK